MGRFLGAYGEVLALPGTLRFSAAALVARLPISMVGLGIVLLVESATGSYGIAGTVSATYVVANAVLALAHGRLVDAFGQARVLPPAILLFTLALVGTVTAVQAGWPRPVAYALAAVAGAAMPQVGACVRARWSHVLDDRRQVQTAFALESVLDEAVFILGPVLVTVLATAWHPVAGLAVAALTGLLGTLAFASQRATEPPSRAASRSLSPEAGPAVRPAMPWRVVGPLALVSVSLGVVFGAAEVATVAFADEQGSTAAAGPLLAVWALGSLLAGVVTGAVTWRIDVAARVRWGTVAMVVAMAPLGLVDSLAVMFPVLLVGGLAIAPTLIATLSMTEQHVPAARLTEGMAILHTGLVAGVAPGAAIAGFVVDHHGVGPAYAVCLVAALVGVLGSQATRLSVARESMLL